MNIEEFKNELNGNKIIELKISIDEFLECEELTFTFENGRKIILLPTFEIIEVKEG